MERHFSRDLESLKTQLIDMGAHVDAQIDEACQALFEGDTEKAQRVIRKDAEVDEMDTLIDKECQRIMALTQPVAIDLRLLLATLKINNQLERIGDIAVNIAERVDALSPHRGFLRSTRLLEMIQIARIMVSDSLEALLQRNPVLARRVLESDDVVDNLDRKNFTYLVEEMKQHANLIDPASHILILSRHIERLADHATNIAEDIIFLVDARVVKHNAFEPSRP